MAYEYESKLYANSVIQSITENVFIETGETKEIKEVYRKAKAWDNYLFSVKEDAKNEFGDNEDLVKHAVELNEKIFMEDE
ncbi:hypothetical protein [Staphylococcus nepalensis]|uniref:hypothetical protein n=1 Tax=Staphylococcus nepalensis TaxID=214473 RepID=UPI003EE5571B